MTKSISDPYIFRPPQSLVTHHSGPLSGKSVAVKDLFHIAGWPTGAGNPDWLKSHTTPDETQSSVAALLRQGAKVIGKTHTDELAYSLNGQNEHYGTLINPKAPDRLPGGSSSGSAIAVADGSADIGLGTDTGGSIRVPAAYNGLYGLRPTHGMLPMQNMVPLAPSYDTISWLTRDLALCAEVSTQLLPADNTHQTAKALVFLTDIMSFSQLSEPTLSWFSDVGLPLEQVSLGLDLITLGDSFRILQGFEIWQTHGQWITSQQPNFASDIEQRLKWCASLTLEDKQQAETIRAAFNDKLTELLHQYIIVLPTTPGPAPLLESSAEYLAQYRNQLMCLTCLAGLTGTPQLHLPFLTVDKAPAGFSLLGSRHSEQHLFKQAHILLEKTP
ncbi:MAG: amidase [Aestuariibacter sp.]